MIKANPYYHWVQSERSSRPAYPRVKAKARSRKRGTRATNREARNGRKHNVSR